MYSLNFRVMEEFITPIVKVSKGSQLLSFYSMPEFEEWTESTANAKSWKVKYYKGLTSEILFTMPCLNTIIETVIFSIA